MVYFMQQFDKVLYDLKELTVKQGHFKQIHKALQNVLAMIFCLKCSLDLSSHVTIQHLIDK